MKQDLYVPLYSNFKINKPDVEGLLVSWYFQSGVNRVPLAVIFNSTFLHIITRRERTVVYLNGSLLVWNANYSDNGTFICEVGQLELFTTVIIIKSTGSVNS